MRNLYVALAGLIAFAACQAPGYDYTARLAPEQVKAADYRDIEIGRFTGPAYAVASAEFGLMIDETVLDGRPWFEVGSKGPQGFYDGDIRVVKFEGERRFELERRCVEYDGPLDCERRAMVERACDTDIVTVEIALTLTDARSGRRVFTDQRDGEARREDCHDLREVPDDGRSEGSFGETIFTRFESWEAPDELMEEAAVLAVRKFRSVIAPYNQTVRAKIIQVGITPEEANDSRFATAVIATRDGDFLAACAQWDALGRAWPKAPAVLHNLGACDEARGDLTSAQARYAEAAALITPMPGLKDKDRKLFFEALARVSGRRADETVIANVIVPNQE